MIFVVTGLVSQHHWQWPPVLGLGLPTSHCSPQLGGGHGRSPGQQQLGDGHAGAQAENNLQRQTFRSKKDYTTGRNGQRYRYLQTDIQTDRQWNYLSSLWSWDHSNTVMYTFNIYYLNKTWATDNYNIYITRDQRVPSIAILGVIFVIAILGVILVLLLREQITTFWRVYHLCTYKRCRKNAMLRFLSHFFAI